MVMSPSPLVSPTEHSETGLVPRAMFTTVTADQSHRTPQVCHQQTRPANARRVCKIAPPRYRHPHHSGEFSEDCREALGRTSGNGWRRPSNQRSTLFAVDGIGVWSLLQSGKWVPESPGVALWGMCRGRRETAAAVFVRLTLGFNARTW